MTHRDQDNNKFSCEIIPLRKSKNHGGTLTQRVGDASLGAKKTRNFLARLSFLGKTRIRRNCIPEGGRRLMRDGKTKKFSCERVPLRKSKNKGDNSNGEGGRCLLGGQENSKFSFDIIPLRKSKKRGEL
jgi:hypothetical protein